MDGLLEVWIYRYHSKKGAETVYWIFHLKTPYIMDFNDSRWIFYDPEENTWSVLERKEFVVDDETCERVDEEKFLRAWKNFLQDANPPFAITDIVTRELQVWTWYKPINSADANVLEENLFWIFHLKMPLTIKMTFVDKEESTITSNWVSYCCCTNTWAALDLGNKNINDDNANYVPFEVLENEWRLMFSRAEVKTPFKLTDIMERGKKK